MKQKTNYSPGGWTRAGMKGVYNRHTNAGRDNKPDLSRFYMRKAMKFYNQKVAPRSFFLRRFNWMMAPLVRYIMAGSMKLFNRQWSQYR